eukprot:CAMPEP_0194054536 /NCGR_PEP_ID=MMETSP0009_2-20130614/53691_1 /TAXON_ID=210454 /ORGANISM="Grammatophora oceanica, Strain CCMP 410" /LENGTH=145 /DNA_ID=CAMNT_0038703055 /DNA_START=65 /DNA_END=499 /DNA_ORIENTATION=-
MAGAVKQKQQPQQQQKREAQRDDVSLLWISTCGAFLNGVFDVVCRKRYGFYVNIVTGTSIRMVTALVDMKWTEVFECVSVIVFFMMGVGWINTRKNGGMMGEINWKHVPWLIVLLMCVSEGMYIQHSSESTRWWSSSWVGARLLA